MRGSLGEKIGEGATADIHAWAPGQVLKLFHARFSSSRLIRHEARVTRAVFAAGGPAPEVFDDVTVDGRFGFVLARHDGPTLLKLLRSGAVTPERAGAILATLMISAHKTAPPPEVRPLRDMIAAFMHANSAVPEPMAKGIHALIERLQPGDGLCHVDLHPQNVIMTAEGPRLVDWTFAVRAPAAFDLGCCHLGLSEFGPIVADDPNRPRATNAALQSEYARLAGLSPAALTAARERYLPLVRAYYFVIEAFPPQLREQMVERIEADLALKGAL